MPARKVLVVDDHAVFRRIISGHLVSEGYEVLTAADAPEALRTADANPDIRLALLDFNMPGTSGVLLSTELATSLPSAQQLFVTGNVELLTARYPDLAERAMSKPYKPQELFAIVRYLVEKAIVASDLGLPGKTVH